jgi:hypothetical protein
MEPAIEWFGTIPFGMNPEGMSAWYYQGDGLKLWEETYAAYNLVPRQGAGVRSADGRMVPEEDGRDRRLHGTEGALWCSNLRARSSPRRARPRS